MEQAIPFVGRRRELEELQDRLREAQAGAGRLVLVEGEAGAGKSTLVRRLMAQAGPALALAGRCPGPGETPPFGPWRELVAALAREEEREPAGLPPPFGTAPGAWSPYETARALAGWLARFERPLLLLVEDLHWADAATLDLTRHLAGLLGELPALVLATVRSEAVRRGHPLWGWLPDVERAGAVRMALGGLGPEEVAELLEALGLGGGESEALARRLHRRTEGLPLFLRDLLLPVVRGGALPGEGEPLPTSVRQSIDRRLADVSPAAQAVLEAAAVLGADFPLALLERTVDLGEEELAGLLEEAVDARLLEPLDAAGERFAFTHTLVREALLGRLAGPRRRRWHARAAAALEAVAPDKVEALALHLQRAGDPRAPGFLARAGDRALRLGAPAEAEERYGQALALLPEGDPGRAELLLKLGWCRQAGGRPGAPEALRQALTAATEAGDRAVEVWARHLLAWLAVVREERGALEEAEAVMAAQEELRGDPRFERLERELFGEVAGYPRAGAACVGVLAHRGQAEEAERLFRRLAARERPSASHDLLNVGMILAFTSDDFAGAAAMCGEAAERAARLGDIRNAARLKANQLLLLLVGPAMPATAVDAVAGELGRLEEELAARGGLGLMPPGYSLAGVYRYFRGDWPGARRDVLECARQHPESFGGSLRWYAGWILLDLGDAAAAQPLLESVPPFRPEDPVPVSHNFLVLAHALRAELCVALGDEEGALAWLEAAEAWPPLARAAFFRANVRVARALYHRRRGEAEAAWRAAREALEDARLSGSSYTLVRAGRLVGRLARERGEEGVAAASLAEAMERAERCRFPLQAALVRLERAALLAGRSATAATAAADLEAARALLAETPAAGALAAAEVELARHGLAPGRGLPSGLTAREAEVAALVAEGLTDRQIAARLAISPRTVDRHLRNIFQKLDLPNRTALALWATRSGLGA
ncbi:MAG: AAA family ATPase [Clostridia bacterium]|nr:AAA family ATPase [Clostridia bacterium]